MGLTHMEVRARVLAWAEANLDGDELDLVREILHCPANQTAQEFAERAENAQSLAEEIVPGVANTCAIEIVVERLDDYRVAFRPTTGVASRGVVGLSHEPGHWSGGIMKLGIPLPPSLKGVKRR